MVLNYAKIKKLDFITVEQSTPEKLAVYQGISSTTTKYKDKSGVALPLTILLKLNAKMCRAMPSIGPPAVVQDRTLPSTNFRTGIKHGRGEASLTFIPRSNTKTDQGLPSH